MGTLILNGERSMFFPKIKNKERMFIFTLLQTLEFLPSAIRQEKVNDTHRKGEVNCLCEQKTQTIYIRKTFRTNKWV